MTCNFTMHTAHYGRPSPALIARADRGYARFLAAPGPYDSTGDHDQDDAAAHR